MATRYVSEKIVTTIRKSTGNHAFYNGSYHA
jgi:hypothetical protein